MNSFTGMYSYRERILKKPTKATFEEWERIPRPIMAHPRYPPSL